MGSRLVWTYHELRGDLPFKIEELHLQYGPVVRIAPDELSFTDPIVMKDIYGGTSLRQLDRDPYIFPPPDFGPKGNLILAGHAEHARLRRVMNEGFTPHAIHFHSNIVRQHARELISHIRERCNTPLNITDLFGRAAFDIIGHLTIGEELRSLAEERNHPLYAFVMKGFVGGLVMSVLNHHGLYSFFKKLIPISILEEQNILSAMIQRRLSLSAAKQMLDFVSYLERPLKSGARLNGEEIEASSLVLLIGGSETVATTLTGACLYLLRNSQRLDRLTNEIRNTFATATDISVETTRASHSPYLSACIEEALRIVTPSPFSLARRTSKPTNIAGYTVPAHTSVGLAQWASFHSPDNFNEPYRFLPERFLSQPTKGYPAAFEPNSVFHPWSFGPRNCPGRNLAYIEMRLILAHLLWNFDMRLDPRHIDFEWRDQKADLVWRRQPLNVVFKERDSLDLREKRIRVVEPLPSARFALSDDLCR